MNLRLSPLCAALWWLLPGAQAAEVDRAVESALAARGVADVLILFHDQARPALAPLSPDAEPRLRRRALVQALRDRAAFQQAELGDWLASRGVAHRRFWLVNALQASIGPAELAALSRREGVARIAANPSIPLRLPPADVSGLRPAAPAAVEWGVAKIRAPEVWATGVIGQGVVIGGQDTGYQWDHPALKAQYRGWNGTAASHARSWHDAIHPGAGSNSCGFDAPAPCDDHGHGTHTAGTFAGDDGGINQIGVAPGARWIGCRNMAAGNGTPATYIECMQWFLAPTDPAGNDPDPDYAPDIISNSWGCPASEGCTVGNELAGAVQTLVEAGIFFAAAAGNDGSACGSILDAPATYDASFVVGSTTATDAITSFSSRGPVAGAAAARPDVVAPGSSVRSAVPGNFYSTMSGTSMATPHVAGAAALMMDANPALKGHPQEVAALLRATAVRDGITDPYRTSCGGLSLGTWPNHQAGWGRIDAWAAVQAATPDVFSDGFEG
jgi:subtilisin family serine protease